MQVTHVWHIRCLLHRHLTVHSICKVRLLLLLLHAAGVVAHVAAILGLVHGHLALAVSFGLSVELHQFFRELLVFHTQVLADLDKAS